MSDAIWYSRLLIWIGALVLLIEAFSGRSYGLTTVIAIVMLIAGLAGLVYGIVAESLAARSSNENVRREEAQHETEG
jgi:membrane-bound ClpP family serine protease